jgi:hypothetical protein
MSAQYSVSWAIVFPVSTENVERKITNVIIAVNIFLKIFFSAKMLCRG